jgi:hypothetical protein
MYVKELPLSLDIDYELFHSLDLDLETTFVFDIETTGFSRVKNQIYLIGCIYYQNHTWYLRQWLSESLKDEILILEAFLSFCQIYKNVLTFNGNRFDIPFVKERCQSLNLDPSPLIALKNVDLYDYIKPYEKFLALENMKQKTLEKFLDLHREDPYSGRDLIGYYYHFLQNKSIGLKKNLLLHNHEDLTGLITILPLLYYKLVFDYIRRDLATKLSQSYIENKRLIIKCEHPYEVPKIIKFEKGFMTLELRTHQILLQVDLIEDELKFFFNSYKDYYYLPDEDQAVHKSIGIYVAQERRTKAKASNCYIKKRGTYIPLFHKIDASLFKKNYQDTMYYIELDGFLNQDPIKKQYLEHLFI